MMLHDIAPHEFHIDYDKQQPEDADLLLCYQTDKALVKRMDNGEYTLPTIEEAKQAGVLTKPQECQYLFAIDQVKIYTNINLEIQAFGDYEYKKIRELRNAKPQWKTFAMATGHQLWSWYRKNQYCGCCGTAMVHSETERAMCCGSCKNIVYPTISPSVIVAVTNGDRILLTRYQPTHSSYRNYALIAGYVETGEAVEDTVRREVMEEVGLCVKNVRYYKSQPWPFSGALLMGFFCELDGEDRIVREENELEEAVWMKRSELPNRSDDISLTSEMMEQFRLGLESK